MLKTGGKISVIVLIVLLLGMTLLHQSREDTSYYSAWTNEGYINVNYFQHVVTTDDPVSPEDFYYYAYSDLGLLTISLIGIVTSIYLLVTKAKEGIFFTSDKLKLGGYVLLVLISMISVILLFPNYTNTGVVEIGLINKLLMLVTALMPIIVLFILNFNKINKLGVSFILTMIFIVSIVFMSFLDMYWFILVLQIMASIVVVSLLLDDIAKVNATVYTEYEEATE